MIEKQILILRGDNPHSALPTNTYNVQHHIRPPDVSSATPLELWKVLERQGEVAHLGWNVGSRRSTLTTSPNLPPPPTPPSAPSPNQRWFPFSPLGVREVDVGAKLDDLPHWFLFRAGWGGQSNRSEQTVIKKLKGDIHSTFNQIRFFILPDTAKI